MSNMSPLKRKLEPRGDKRPASKKIRRQQAYDSGSSSDSEEGSTFVARDAPPTKKSGDSGKTSTSSKAANGSKGRLKKLPTPTPEDAEEQQAGSEESPATSSEDSEIFSDESGSDEDENEDENGQKATRTKTNRRNPEVFASSMAAILSSKLPTTKRQDPVLARSRDAQEASHELAEGRLEAKAKRKLRDEKRLAKERGRVKDVLLGEPVLDTVIGPNGTTTEHRTVTAAEIAEQEKRLRKTAQRGVVKLFNAVRAAQVRGEQASRAVREKGVVGHQQREEKVGEMGRQAFLDMVGGGGHLQEHG